MSRSRRFHTCALFAASMVMIAAASAHADRLKERAKRKYDEGVAAMGQKDYETAANRFHSAVGLEPLPAYKVALCEASTLWEDWERAEGQCAAALASSRGAEKQKVETLIARRTQAVAAEYVKDAKDAVSSAEWDDAAEYYQKAIAVDPRAAYYLALCDVFDQANRKLEAAKACDGAAARSNGSAKSAAAARAKNLRLAESNKPTAKQQEHLDKAGNAVASAFGLNLKMYEERDKHTYLAHTQDCLDALAAAEAAGVAPFHELRVDKAFPGARERRRAGSGPAYYAPFENARAVCEAKWTAVRSVGASLALEAALERLASIAAGKVGLNDGDIAYAGIPVAACKKAVAAALAAGVPATSKVAAGSATVVLGAADATVCSKLETEVKKLHTALAAKREAERQAKLAPFKAVLKGDKMRYYEEYGMYDLRVYGPQAYELSSPRDFDKAKVWFLVLNGEDKHGRTTWILRRLQFNGSKLQRETEKTGLGSEPPTKAYR